jgi:hypothetical protein
MEKVGGIMGAEQEAKIIIEEAEQTIRSLKKASTDDVFRERLEALRECILILGRKIDENADYITEIYKEIPQIKERS